MPSTKKRSRGRAAARSDALVPKEPLAGAVASIIRDLDLTQREAGLLVGEAPSQMSLLLSGKLRGFSSDRLIRMLLRLGRDVEMVLRAPKTGGKRVGKVRVAVR